MGWHSLCQVVRYARLYMGCSEEIFCIFSAIWISFLKKLSTFVMQDDTQLQEFFCILFHKVCFLEDGYLFRRSVVMVEIN